MTDQYESDAAFVAPQKIPPSGARWPIRAVDLERLCAIARRAAPSAPADDVERPIGVVMRIDTVSLLHIILKTPGYTDAKRVADLLALDLLAMREYVSAALAAMPSTRSDAGREVPKAPTPSIGPDIGGAWPDCDCPGCVAKRKRASAPIPAHPEPAAVEQFGIWLAAYQEDIGRDLEHNVTWYTNFYSANKDAEHIGDCPHAVHKGPITCSRCVCDEMVRFARAALSRMPARQGWRSIESAPSKGKVWVFGGRAEEPELVLADGEYWTYSRKYHPKEWHYTHWLPCEKPAPPRDEMGGRR